LAGLRDFLGGAGLAEARISAELLGSIAISTEGRQNAMSRTTGSPAGKIWRVPDRTV
jgi:hypothetical protein